MDYDQFIESVSK